MQCSKVDLCIFISYPSDVNVLNYKPLKVASLWLKWLPFNDDRLMMAWLVFSQLTLQKIFFMTWWGLVLTWWGQINELNLPSNQIFLLKVLLNHWRKKALIFWMQTQVRHDKLDDKVRRHLRMTIFLNIKWERHKVLEFVHITHIISENLFMLD